MMRRGMQRFRKDSAGGVMIEAAIGVPFFIILISSIIQLGFIANSYVQMQEAVRFAAREMSVKRVDSGGASYSNTCASAMGGTNDTGQYLACNEVQGLPGSYSVLANADDAGSSVVRLTVPLNQLLFFNIGFLGGGGTLTAEASYVNEEDPPS
jgi:hypothetical protein